MQTLPSAFFFYLKRLKKPPQTTQPQRTRKRAYLGTTTTYTPVAEARRLVSWATAVRHTLTCATRAFMILASAWPVATSCAAPANSC